jgi:hypothetical protein
MNILTYATQVAIKPKHILALSLYKDTLTHKNFLQHGWGIMQLLSPSLASLVPLLGKQSGRDVNKELELNKCGESLESLTLIPEIWSDTANNQAYDNRRISVLAGCPIIYWIKSLPKQPIIDAGDHDVVFCEIVDCYRKVEEDGALSNGIEGEVSYLTTSTLRSMKII